MYVLDFNLSTNAYGWTLYLHGFRSIANLIAKKINEFESLHLEMYRYLLGNRGIIFPLTLVVHVLLIIISPSNI